MAKKKKKQFIKLNNQIRAIFKGEPFESGILTLDNEVIKKLYYQLFAQSPDKNRDETIRALRRLWSEGNYNIRREIVEFLLKLNRVDTKEDLRHTIQKLLDEIEVSNRELNLLVDSFWEIKNQKITKIKLMSKLNYLRVKERVLKFEKSLNIEFTPFDEIEFAHSFQFSIFDETFNKLILLKSRPLNIDTIINNSDDEVFNELNSIKESLILQKRVEIDRFIRSLKDNIYLELKDARKCLKRLPIDCELKHIPIDTIHIQKIIKTHISDKISIMMIGEYFEIEKIDYNYIFGQEISHKLQLSYEKDFLYSLIWDSLEFPILDDFKELKSKTITQFNLSLNELLQKMREMISDIDISDDEIKMFALKYLQESIRTSERLEIKSKLMRRVLYHFREYLKPIKEQKKKEELLAKTIRDFKLLYPIARELNRKVIFNVGPTNSGKTYSAVKRLAEVDSGYYLAPLRLLALEGYERLRDFGINISLITGEEEIIDEDSTHISSTIEMLNSSVEVDVCVIDEIQMIADKDRGWAWVNALIGAPAKEIILTGSSNALSVVKELCNYLGEELIIKEFKRKNSLKMLKKPTPINKIKPHSAIITFSRREVLALRHKLSHKYSISVIYGNLSPEVRREEAKRFREGKSSILIATDAIAMGLNLPIQSIIFARDNKFDGLGRRELKPIEVIQIAGRAGRYGFHEEGFIGALDKHTLENISKKLYKIPKELTLPLRVKATLEHITLISEIIGSDSLFEILEFFSQNMEFDGPFIAGNIESMLKLANIVDSYKLDLKTKYIFASAPISLQSPHLEMVFHQYLSRFQNGEIVPFEVPKSMPRLAKTQEELLKSEDRVKEISLYLWLSFKFPDRFLDTQKAKDTRKLLNSFIERSLRVGKFKKLCKVCGKELNFDYRYNVCERCFSQPLV